MKAKWGCAFEIHFISVIEKKGEGIGIEIEKE